jgi:hypothetical protein
MKKILLSLGAMFFVLLTYAQPVSDNATIPVSVTLNSVLRLHVTSGGNIEFAFNTLEQMQSGIGVTTSNNTKFTVASSQTFSVNLVAESDFTSTDSAGGSGGSIPPLSMVGYTITSTTGETDGTSSDWLDAMEVLSTSTTPIIIDGEPGDGSTHGFQLAWECGTTNVASAGSWTSTVLSNGYSPDRYSTNVFLTLRRQ